MAHIGANKRSSSHGKSHIKYYEGRVIISSNFIRVWVWKYSNLREKDVFV